MSSCTKWRVIRHKDKGCREKDFAIDDKVVLAGDKVLIKLKRIDKVLLGKCTETLLKPSVHEAEQHLFFSLINAKKSSYDFQVLEAEQRQEIVLALLNKLELISRVSKIGAAGTEREIHKLRADETLTIELVQAPKHIKAKSTTEQRPALKSSSNSMRSRRKAKSSTPRPALKSSSYSLHRQRSGVLSEWKVVRFGGFGFKNTRLRLTATELRDDKGTLVKLCEIESILIGKMAAILLSSKTAQKRNNKRFVSVIAADGTDFNFECLAKGDRFDIVSRILHCSTQPLTRFSPS